MKGLYIFYVLIHVAYTVYAFNLVGQYSPLKDGSYYKECCYETMCITLNSHSI